MWISKSFIYYTNYCVNLLGIDLIKSSTKFINKLKSIIILNGLMLVGLITYKFYTNATKEIIKLQSNASP